MRLLILVSCHQLSLELFCSFKSLVELKIAGTDGPEFVHQDKAPQELQHSEQIQFDQDPKNMMEGTEPEVDDLPTGEGLNHSCDQLQMETFELTDSEDESENEE
eukprot:TRINITY_DN9355_c0_g1_i2.p2 TRINITY_DN9355_c0_g1~~TRINITY_DN9355_c0_g1_i2.p2  ORF type:complete len:104 (+),score=21.63 TRINITY_DN9355_c0_g1_i2:1108-1419(+)